MTLSLQSFETPGFWINENESKRALGGEADDIRAPNPGGLCFQQREANAKSPGLQLCGKMEIYETQKHEGSEGSIHGPDPGSGTIQHH